MRRVQQIMGMPISIDIVDYEDESVFDKAFERLCEIDERFSTYKPGSEVTRFANGEIQENNLSNELREVIIACKQAEKETDGYFSAWASGNFDPSGYVKGWAIAQVGRLIEKSGYGTFCIGAGGDVLARSKSDKVWQIGIQNPNDRSKILDLLSIRSGAVCTSGNYERGAHIYNPRTHKPADQLQSITITGPDIIKADVLATACFAMGVRATEFMKNYLEYKAINITNA